MSDNIEDKLKAVFANPKTREMVASAIAAPRPNGWSKHSKASYFKREYAEEIQPHIDAQIANPTEDLIFRYDKWCTVLKVSERTLYIRFNQAILFLCERMDPDGKYKKWYESVDIDCKSSTIGIVMSMVKVSAARSLKPELITPRLSLPQWRKELMDWLESDDQEPFVREGLALSPEEIIALRDEFLPNEGLLSSIKANSVSVVKV